MINTELSPYERLGGEQALRQLVNDFYDLMGILPEAKHVRAMHPQDLSTSREKLLKFLSGWLGGPQLYIEEYGHPRLRTRHLSFSIGEAERDAWMLCMEKALGNMEMDDLLRSHLTQSLWKTADHMRNREE